VSDLVIYLRCHLMSILLSLKNHGVEDETEEMFIMGEETMDLPLDEKMKFEQGDSGSSFGYLFSSLLWPDLIADWMEKI
jgi:hypothetical protein